MKPVALRASDYRWLAELSASEQQVVLALLVELDAWIIDGDPASPIGVAFASELMDDRRYVTDDGARDEA